MDVRPPASVPLPSSIFMEKNQYFNKPADSKGTEGMGIHAISSHSGRFSASQTGPSALSASNIQKHGGSTTSADSQSATEHITGNRSSNVSGDRLPHLVEKSSAAPRVDPESTDWKTRAKEDEEKRLREKEEQLRVLQVTFLSFFEQVRPGRECAQQL